MRGLCVSICVATHWLFNSVIAQSMLHTISNINYGMNFVFGACTTLAVPFVRFVVPETKGMKLDQVDALLGGGGFIPRSRQSLRRADEEGKRKAAVEQIESVYLGCSVLRECLRVSVNATTMLSLKPTQSIVTYSPDGYGGTAAIQCPLVIKNTILHRSIEPQQHIVGK